MIRGWDTTRRCAGRPVLRVWLAPAGNGWGRRRRQRRLGARRVVSLCPDLRVCLLLKALLVLHCKLALYYVQQSGAVSQLSVQTSLPRGMCCLHVLKAMGCARHTWPLSGSGDIILR